MMRPSLVLVLLLAGALAGCASAPSESGSTTTATTPTPATTNSTWGGGSAAFVLTGPVLHGPGNRPEGSFYEDDNVSARYEVSLTGDTGGGSATAIVSFLVDGKVVDVQTVTLAPGEAKKFDRPLNLGNATVVKVEVKMGAASGKAEAKVLRWPRVGDELKLGNATIRVASWANETSGFRATGDATASLGATARATLLCLDEKGVPQPRAARDVPTSEAAPMPFDLVFDPCSRPYALDVSVRVPDAPEQAGRILLRG